MASQRPSIITKNREQYQLAKTTIGPVDYVPFHEIYAVANPRYQTDQFRAGTVELLVTLDRQWIRPKQQSVS